MHPPQTLTLFSPAKINLFLAVTGRRPDGYHDLLSVAAPLDFGDELTARVEDPKAQAASQFTLECDDPAVPVDGDNLVLQAAAAFATETGWRGAAAFRLAKRIPTGAGLGGGSSNAVAALRALNQLGGARLGADTLAALAARIGSDCPLFLPGGPVVMRGRGEQVEPLPAAAAARLHGRRVLLFKPASVGVATPWAYGRLAATGAYLPAAEAEHRLATWLDGRAGVEELLFNSFEAVVFRKFLALPALLERLQREFALAPRLSGSGSACFAFLPADAPVAAITAAIREAWGTVAFVREARLV
ncbi:MAG TPA: 4-(cytidine 5'-diphospho)-2-C-methyl-D-erythritol kinase [Opitutaceae bacterium]|nr:4-(cytidine 5'-diphospho)-2-C-methyl-D-erythritol kinase [Opitutaceae bacterium]